MYILYLCGGIKIDCFSFSHVEWWLSQCQAFAVPPLSCTYSQICLGPCWVLYSGHWFVSLSLSLQLLQIFIYCCFICSVFFGSKNFLSLYFFLPHEIFEVYFSPKCGRFCELSFCYWFLTCTVVSKWGLYATDSLKFESCFVASWLVFQLLLEWLRRLCTHRLLGQGRHINIYIYANTCICLRSSIGIVAFKSFLTNFLVFLSVTEDKYNKNINKIMIFFSLSF